MRTRDGINLFFSYKNIYQRIYRDYMPVVLGDNSISVGGKVIETVKFSGQAGDPLGTGEPVLTERMYPPVRNFTSANTTVSGQTYGNGLYEVTYSTTAGGNQEPWTCFNTSFIYGGSWAYTPTTTYTSGTYNGTQSFDGGTYKGDWLKIKLPVSIKLTRYSFLQRTDYPNRSPNDFKIYGSNNNTTWDVLIDKRTITYASYSYQETVTTVQNYYQYYLLVVNKLVGNDVLLNFDEWYIYGIEQIVPVIINNEFKYMAFLNDGANQKSYTINFPEAKTCDILVVAGGGGGGTNIGSGGGAGGLLYYTGLSISQGNYTILVGSGGAGAPDGVSRGSNGNDSSAFGYTSYGGGGGAGQSWVYNASQTAPGALQKSATNQGSGAGGTRYKTLGNEGTVGQGNSGGNASPNTYIAGGGGGADEVGKTATNSAGGGGGNGKSIDITGTFLYYAGGGAGGGQTGTSGFGALGGLGGGGNSAPTNGGTIYASGISGENGKGGGGGAGNSLGGNGGSGIVIIRYPRKTIPFDAQWTYNTLNANVYYLGNVGIGITNPTNALHVIGNTHSTTYSAGKKTFKIEHPLKINKWLYHGCIEGPRFDNIYRGKKLITEGKCQVNIDKECNTTGGMTSGTFSALNTNHQLYLQNNQTYDVVKGTINGSIINIECENITDEIEIDWLVIGERHDEHVINTPLTDNDGNLVCEHNMSGYVNTNDIESESVPITNVDITDESITDVNN